MNWKRQDIGMNYTKNYIQILVISICISFLLKQYFLLSLLSFLLFIAILHTYYYQRVGNKLEFINEKKRIRLIKDSTSNLLFSFQNEGLPIWNGNLIISFQTPIAPNGITDIAHTGFYEVKVPFSIGYKKKVTIKIPIKGVQRGLARIKKMEIQIPHPFTEGSVQLDFKPFILMEAIVFPQIYPIDEELLPSRLKQGYLELNSSLYDDPFFPVGTRQYELGDQFHHIHWKASAKTQELQTKVFTKVADVSVLFVLNVKKYYGVVADFEEKIEWLASHIEACYKKDIPYSFMINVRTFGKYPLVYLPMGSGDIHRIQALSLLSILSKTDSLIPFNQMIFYIDSNLELPVAVYVMTHDLEQYVPAISKWEKRTNVIYEANINRREDYNG
ncbi:DUF58 domain-containing protein [Bacillus sp. FJAT-22090]|uniref:DUF58 domain-containing protein n=1 Tax=Bacillus sp. FJAT-22090 TaxID=1581038 RepID=UPI0011A982F9|nr:DUF58 domain-containing protein [Bacillus sp. FJAT-22090]